MATPKTQSIRTYWQALAARVSALPDATSGTAYARNDQPAPVTLSGTRDTGFTNTAVDSHAIYAVWPTTDYSSEISVGSSADGSSRYFCFIQGGGSFQIYKKVNGAAATELSPTFNFNAVKAAGKELRVGYRKNTDTTATLLIFFDGTLVYSLDVAHVGGQYARIRVDAASGPPSISYGPITPRLTVANLAFVGANDRRPKGTLKYATQSSDASGPTGWTVRIERRSGQVVVAAQPVTVNSVVAPGEVTFTGTTAVPDSERGQDVVFVFQQAGLATATTSGILTMPAETISMAVNPNPALYYYFNTPTSNKNSGSWRSAKYGGSPDLREAGLLDAGGSPIAAAYDSGKRPAMFIHPPRVPGQRMRLIVDSATLTGIDWGSQGHGSLANIATPVTSGGSSYIDFTWNWSLADWLKSVIPSGDPLMFIAPLFSGANIPQNVRLYEINGDGSRVSPTYWDAAFIAEYALYAKFLFGLRFMDMQNIVGLSSAVFSRVSQQGDVGQAMLHSVPDLLNLLDLSGCTGRFHIPLQATEAWVRTEARRTAVWARLRNKPVMWTLSNEIWNPGQGAWQTIAQNDNGGRQGLGYKAVDAGLYPAPPNDNGNPPGQHAYVMRYQAYRHKQVMTWVTEEFTAEGVANLLVRNVDLQNDAPGNNDAICKDPAISGVSSYIDAISTAPYLGYNTGSDLAATDTATLASRIKALTGTVYARREIHRKYAVANGWKFYEYEGAFEEIRNSPLWRNFMASADGANTLAYMLDQHDTTTGGNFTFYTDFRQDHYSISQFIGQTGAEPAAYPSLMLKLWHDRMLAA